MWAGCGARPDFRSAIDMRTRRFAFLTAPRQFQMKLEISLLPRVPDHERHTHGFATGAQCSTCLGATSYCSGLGPIRPILLRSRRQPLLVACHLESPR